VGIAYLQGQPWSSWTRDERFFCSVLYSHASADPGAFAEWLITSADLSASPEGEWDLGYEVCFYRDYLWQQPCDSARKAGLPAKRTFDLCLFGERDIVVIEAKVCQAFGGAQNEDFAQDKARIGSLPGLEAVNVHLVALASAAYLGSAKRRPSTLNMFDGRISWADVNARYPDRLFQQADRMYRVRPGEMLREPVKPEREQSARSGHINLTPGPATDAPNE
jgi:hypothetical protein